VLDTSAVGTGVWMLGGRGASPYDLPERASARRVSVVGKVGRCQRCPCTTLHNHTLMSADGCWGACAVQTLFPFGTRFLVEPYLLFFLESVLDV
jgi:hypothetical protein